MLRIISLVFVLAVAVVGCTAAGDSGPRDGAVDGPPWERTCWSGGGQASADVELVMGFGLGDFQPVEAEQDLPIFRGTQPGRHIELNARMRGFFPGDVDDGLGPAPHTMFSVRRESNGEVLSVLPCTTPLPYRSLGDGWYELAAPRVIIMDERDGLPLDGARVLVRMEVQDPEGRYGQLEVPMVLREEPLGPAPTDAGVPDAAGPDAGP